MRMWMQNCSFKLNFTKGMFKQKRGKKWQHSGNISFVSVNPFKMRFLKRENTRSDVISLKTMEIEGWDNELFRCKRYIGYYEFVISDSFLVLAKNTGTWGNASVRYKQYFVKNDIRYKQFPL